MSRRPVSWPGAGMNYGHHLGTYDQTAVDVDLLTLKNAGYNYIRVAMNPYDVSQTKIRNVVLRVLAAGMIPMYGVGASAGQAVNSTRWTSFLAALETEAAWARDNNIPYFLMGNEEELHVDGTTITWSQAAADLVAKADVIKNTVGYTGKIVYAASNTITSVNTWTSNSMLGRIDYISWNMYFDLISGGANSWQTKLAVRLATLPGRTFVSEWSNINAFQGATVNQNEKAWQAQLEKMYCILACSGMPIGCFFAFTDGSFGLPTDYWALKLSTGQMRWAWDALRN